MRLRIHPLQGLRRIIASSRLDFVIKLILVACGLALVGGLLYLNARIDASLEARTQVNSIEVNKNGETLAQLLAQSQANGKALLQMVQSEIATIRSQETATQQTDAQLQAEIDALSAQLQALQNDFNTIQTGGTTGPNSPPISNGSGSGGNPAAATIPSPSKSLRHHR